MQQELQVIKLQKTKNKKYTKKNNQKPTKQRKYKMKLTKIKRNQAKRYICLCICVCVGICVHMRVRKHKWEKVQRTRSLFELLCVSQLFFVNKTSVFCTAIITIHNVNWFQICAIILFQSLPIGHKNATFLCVWLINHVKNALNLFKR